MMGTKRLSEQQLRRLRDIKYYGEYRRTNGAQTTQIHRETLWEVLYQYLILHNRQVFKARYFRKIHSLDGRMRTSLYPDLPLSRGEIVNAIKYGVENGFLKSLGGTSGHIRWCLTIMEEKI